MKFIKKMESIYLKSNEMSKFDDDFIKKHIIMINNIYEDEILLNMINRLSYRIVKTQNFIIFDKEWLEKWKKIVGYEIIKDKCTNSQNREELKKEIIKLFTKLNTKQKLEELGKMDCSKFKRNNLFDISNLP